jgi:cytochrome P450
MITEMQGVDDSRFFQRRRRSILSVDGEDHARLRRLVAPAFTPKSADRLRPFMREVINGLIDKVAPTGQCEFVEDICEPYPIPIICELLGAPKEDWKLFSNWASDIFRIFNNDLENDMPRIDAASDELDLYVRAMIDERRSKPADDLLSDLIAIEQEGDRLDTDDLVGLAEAVLMAGTDTTRNQLACSVALFTEYPDQWALLRERPELARRAVEETMRFLGAIRGTMRIAGDDIEYRDVVFPAGTFVATSLSGANFDDAAFDAPETFDMTKERDTPQMTFGSGIHFCLGASLARTELAEALPLLARRMPNLTVDGSIEWKPSTVGIWGPARLPLRFDPGH